MGSFLEGYEPIAPTVDCQGSKDPNCEYEPAFPAAAQLYYYQLYVERRFQEFQPIDKYARGKRITPLVDISLIDRTPVSFVIPISDKLCPPELSEWLYSLIRSQEKYVRYERGGHFAPGTKGDVAYLQHMV
mmetsp:Transcript_46331/g.61339  ORF Transcript_46331/g.61339 Transcript_46331/m.61339 type:complete len:131 (-) Transcript_46331:56-448(-)|eukprot:CAMPEP_0185617766 /NCGR_PEP_ID=MMETSP0436-20130131/44673_1 /TAXON_ID=626734 ORGANISM="Favella taraikaensis, Strain Fe Narragansett Bay" /NCGR_SAMPLE_ID=MMETSP0436 /ASSEMBLY_ACC=CAM_ASM_000390 /LENGTH=130 /DNA_ID=CAMNT_0028255719 /DNA_START=89 /DNA_END=481 /DNA_ORIENTATION=-